MKNSVIGLDVGTHSARVSVFDKEGNKLYSDSRKYATVYQQEGWAEQNPNDWWGSIDGLMMELHKNVQIDSIEALALDTTTCTVVLADKNNEPVGNAILWEDNRAKVQAEQIKKVINGRGYTAYGSITPESMLAKCLWLKQRDRRYNKVFIQEGLDWLNRKVSGNNQTIGSKTIAIRKWNYRLDIEGWEDSFLETIGLEDIKTKWPKRFAEPTDTIGTLDEKLRLRWHLPKIKIIAGTLDSYAHQVGIGVIDANGDAALLLGGSINICAVVDEVDTNRGLKLSYNPITKGLNIVSNGIISGGLSLDWFINNFCGQEKTEAKTRGVSVYDVMDKKISKIPAGSNRVIFMPYLQGGSRSHGDPNMKGGFYGIHIRVNKDEMYKAIYEGIAYNLRYIIEEFEEKGVHIKRLIAGGGGDKEIFLQIISDVTGLSIRRTKNNESATLGSAMIALVGSGIYSSLREAKEHMLENNGTIRPNSTQTGLYEPFYKKYLELHEKGAVY